MTGDARGRPKAVVKTEPGAKMEDKTCRGASSAEEALDSHSAYSTGSQRSTRSKRERTGAPPPVSKTPPQRTPITPGPAHSRLPMGDLPPQKRKLKLAPSLEALQHIYHLHTNAEIPSPYQRRNTISVPEQKYHLRTKAEIPSPYQSRNTISVPEQKAMAAQTTSSVALELERPPVETCKLTCNAEIPSLYQNRCRWEAGTLGATEVGNCEQQSDEFFYFIEHVSYCNV
ncbi:UNVERIFIED_CONTAM: hypothetical protein FKN15_025112 [Acipenser sinensis]